jgi:glycosyltransferase involved in cell wall biosynthesis
MALAHDYLNSWGGGERVLALFHERFPKADIVTITKDDAAVHGHLDTPVITSFLQRLPFGIGWKFHRWFLVFMPLVVSSLSFKHYDIVLSDSSGFIKGIRTPKGVRHVCYLHTTTRYLTTDAAYFRDNVPSWLQWSRPFIQAMLSRADYLGAQRPDVIVANSQETAERCERYYHRRPDLVLFPPVDTRKFRRHSDDEVGDYYLAAGRLTPYKRFDLCIEACALLGRRLVIVGTGPEEEKLRALAAERKADVEFLGKVTDEVFRSQYAQCRAFLFPPLEDAGMTPLEAMSCGRPVLAYGKGGALESVRDGVSGLFFHEQTPEALAACIEASEKKRWKSEEITAHAAQFSEKRFLDTIEQVVTGEYLSA